MGNCVQKHLRFHRNTKVPAHLAIEAMTHATPTVSVLRRLERGAGHSELPQLSMAMSKSTRRSATIDMDSRDRSPTAIDSNAHATVCALTAAM